MDKNHVHAKSMRTNKREIREGEINSNENGYLQNC